VERREYFFWYFYLLTVLHRELRGNKAKAHVFKPKNGECSLPQDAVREELRHVFKEDWRCDLGFNDIDMTVTMKDER